MYKRHRKDVRQSLKDANRYSTNKSPYATKRGKPTTLGLESRCRRIRISKLQQLRSESRDDPPPIELTKSNRESLAAGALSWRSLQYLGSYSQLYSNKEMLLAQSLNFIASVFVCVVMYCCIQSNCSTLPLVREKNGGGMAIPDTVQLHVYGWKIYVYGWDLVVMFLCSWFLSLAYRL